MYRELKTPVDFFEALNALNNSQSQPIDYLLRTFGYCKSCNGITEYDIETPDKKFYENLGDLRTDDNYYFIVCLNCHQKDLGNGDDSPYTYLTLQREKDIPLRFRRKVKKLNSRKYQKKIFNEELKKFSKDIVSKSQSVN